MLFAAAGGQPKWIVKQVGSNRFEHLEIAERFKAPERISNYGFRKHRFQSVSSSNDARPLPADQVTPVVEVRAD